MAEKVARLGVSREKGYLYFIREDEVWKAPMKRAGQAGKGKQEKVADLGVSRDGAYMYFLDKDGDVARVKRAVGGQRRKKSAARAAAKKVTKKPAAKKAAAKKPAAKKAPAKAAKKPMKKGKKR